MKFLDTQELVVSTLSPVHIGCGEDYEPTEYVVDTSGVLHRFNAGILPDLSDAGISSDILTILSNDEAHTEQLRAVHKVLSKYRDKIIPLASVHVSMCTGVHAHYKSTQDKKNDFNRNGVERTSYQPFNQLPYLPGSSIKGAIRTAILNEHIAGNNPCSTVLMRQIQDFNTMIEEYDPGNGKLLLRLKLQHTKWDYDRARKNIEKAIADVSSALGTDLLGGKFETDPLRALKVSDAAPLDIEIEREIRFCLNRSRSGRRSQAQVKNLYTRLEYILEHQPAAFSLSLTLQNLHEIAGRRNHRNELISPSADKLLLWTGIVKACNSYYLNRLDDDLAMLGKLYPTSEWRKQTQSILDAGLRDQIKTGNCLLLRIGKHGGANSNTVSGRQIKIMLNEDKREANGKEEKIRLYTFDDESRTIWYCGDDLDKPSDLLPHGWIVLSNPDQIWHADLPGFERRCARQQAIAESARRQAEAAAAEQAKAAAQAAREAALAAMTENQRRIEAFVSMCARRAEQLRGGKENPNAAIHTAARELVKAALEGADWTIDEKCAVADAIEEWLPKLVKVELKDERKKLKLSALRT
ncbi:MULTISPECIES: type III-A CRISPR-associated RAMP protein Csm5 [Nitrosomonas]|uniref:CRISPR system Cms protein Csm5 n=1 Tax=Nitrosomonas europaea (strain ATCC 19718 / CIP 103999 / KCTC 2705 / NBRC 14298) TaxID=228410 RepID=Q82XX3_NITEU|nr:MULTISPECIES: type III-A CRISPR-associated RAMP protein Csm5 [Nitrosomonas]CAD84030.1 hypothetical protein NE0119 [Nitrosomonas europaea ATCC 19718]SDW01517.1 CRISPR-associated protein, Csm5 family [Nitrosomonas europaea]SES65318.1 CRISPR-associated protein, Csm5 family [Nitrosomonas europaea]SJZ29782.1 CRISPR-associated protein, Csm5 family [Nitrosomonas europaea]HBF24951.1 type III-A CRISPR-associated RAMP protein Csm5 [Nitrosomonas sp.]